MPSILGANTLSSGYDVANSLRFDDDSSDYLNRTPGSAGNRKTFTISLWIKRANLVDARLISCHSGNSDSGNFELDFNNDTFRYVAWDTNFRVTNRLFRDTSAWYHIVTAVDTTDSTAGDRIKIYVNGVQETSFASSSNPSENFDTGFNQASTTRIGLASNSTNGPFDGYMAEVVFIDGTALDPTSFGEFDSNSPTIWKPKDVSGLTFGTNGFYLEFKQSGTSQNSSGLGADTSGNDNHFAVNNLTAVDQSTDTCTNNHATLNNLFPEANVAYSEGNLKVTADGSANWSSVIGTIGLTAGKWYWEWTATSSSNAFAGIVSEALVNSTLISDATPYDQNGLILYFTDGRKTVDGTSTESHFTAWSSGTMSFALDLDSGTRTIKMYHNGSQTGDTINLTANFASGDSVFPVFMVNAGSNTSLQNINFGSPPYANSSDAADENGYGAFEFAPPSGYLAICTKNLGSDGG